MTTYTLIQNARLITESSERIEKADLLLKTLPGGREAALIRIDGKIARDALDGTVSYINARGNLVLPPFADLSVCVRDPGAMYKESFGGSLKAALHGGFDTFLTFFEPDGKILDEELLAYWHSLPEDRYVTPFFTTPAFTKSGSLVPLDILDAFPDTILSNRFVGSDNRAILLDAMKACCRRGKGFVLYPRVASLSREGVVNSHIAPKLHVAGIAPIAEEIAVSEGIMLAEEAGCRLHISGVSTAKSVAIVRRAKAEGASITADTAPVYFSFTESELWYQGSACKLMPPLREEGDRLAVIEGIVDGTIDAIASHHMPNDKSDYLGRSLQEAPFGAVGLETVLPATVETLLTVGKISIMRLYELLSASPRKILKELGVPLSDEHTLSLGKTPHFNIISLDKAVTIDRSFIHGRAINTPFYSRVLQGKVEEIFRFGMRV